MNNDVNENEGRPGRSKLLICFGILFIIYGLKLLTLGSPGETGANVKDEVSSIAGAWLLLCGAGIAAHRMAGFQLFLAGLAIVELKIVIGLYAFYGTIAAIAFGVAITAIPFALVALCIWSRANYLRPWFEAADPPES
ncbi:putative membrane protein [Sphingobium fontiphilum]|uniref:Putative membrane protein n=1 Tax=Sphingobium fontiphilum TaxID=944425 RepID=A0A7W6DF66_9SPHN|nr:hypothetical protein [Sphingobium fontiphilum]MBB3981459.1 putative membrane protein [Sphingobium fontiphilum]